MDREGEGANPLRPREGHGDQNRPHAIHGRGRRGQSELAANPGSMPKRGCAMVSGRAGYLLSRSVRQPGDELEESEGDGGQLGKLEIRTAKFETNLKTGRLKISNDRRFRFSSSDFDFVSDVVFQNLDF